MSVKGMMVRKGFMWMLLFSLVLTTALIKAETVKAAGTVSLTADTSAKTATMSNEYVTLKFDSSGSATSLVKGGKELIGPAKGFYMSNSGGNVTGLSPTQLKVVTNTTDMADIAYIGTLGELHYVVRSGVSGVYSYFIAGNPGTVDELRTVYRVDGSLFRNGYNAERSGQLPTLAQIQSGTSLQDETWQMTDGSVYTKYDWSSYVSKDTVHGVYGNGYGVWVIPVSTEYYGGGPLRQDLMVHTESATGDAVVLNMLQSVHFGTTSTTIPSGKMYGPWLVYVNNGDSSDAKSRASTESAGWPYSWLSNSNYPLSRTTVTGQLKVADGRSAAGATVVLAKSGGEFYAQGTDYIFYANADSNGNFSIPKVRPGSYSLYAYATSGNIAQQFQKDNITVSGSSLSLGTLTWTPPKYTNSLWQIGVSDRKSSEFKYGNVARQYGLPAKVPANLTYTVGSSTDANDWYYAQTKVGSWDVNFNLSNTYSGTGYLTVAISSVARNPKVDVYVNGTVVKTLDYSTSNDQTTYRSANQSGRYRLVEIPFSASLLKSGANTVSFKMTSVSTDGGVMYDMIRLETN